MPASIRKSEILISIISPYGWAIRAWNRNHYYLACLDF
jgi:hypothetical protein